MKVSIITSCTGRKTATTPNQLTQADFEKGASHLRRREAELAQWMRPAVALAGLRVPATPGGTDHDRRLPRGAAAERRQHHEPRVRLRPGNVSMKARRRHAE